MNVRVHRAGRVFALVAVVTTCIWCAAGAGLAVTGVGGSSVQAADGDVAANAPTISNVQASTSATTATIIWETDDLASGRVEYGETAEYGSTNSSFGYDTSHSVDLEGLSPLTTYHYKVVSTGFLFSGTSESGDYTFTTLEHDDKDKPRISDVAAAGITATSATITWTTDEESNSEVNYGLSDAYGLTETVADLVKSHSVTLTGLTQGLTYHFRVKSTDSSGNTAVSSKRTFRTGDGSAPVISGVTVSGITATDATIAWTTDVDADSQVEYGLTTAYGSATTLYATLTKNHTVALTGLTAGTTYHCRAQSKDAEGRVARSADCEFSTLNDAPPVISGMVATDITSTGATIKWETDERATSQVEYGPTANYGSATTVDSTWLLSHSVILTSLTSQTTYHYRVKSTDAEGNSAESSDATFTTNDINAPVISGVAATGITETSTVIVWVTDSASMSQVEYGQKASYGLTSTLDANLVTSHSVALSGLSPGTTYHYKVKSRDASGLWSESSDYTFITGGGSTAGGPMITSLTDSVTTSSGATIVWNTNELATAQVEYGLTEAYGSLTALDANLVISHSVDLSGLKSGQTYHYRVISEDAEGNQTVSVDKTFSTKIGDAPIPSLPMWGWAVIGVMGALLVGSLFLKNR